MQLNPFKLLTPKTLPQAIDLYQEHADLKILAGGTFLINNLKSFKKKDFKTPEYILSLRKIKELKNIFIEDKNLIIQSMVTIHDLYENSLIHKHLSILADVCKNIATTPIRNMATIGGNLTCRYTWTEIGSIMIALNASFYFSGPNKEIEIVSAEDFFNKGAKNNKILSHLKIPLLKENKTKYYRFSKSSEVDIPLVSLCLKTQIIDSHFSQTKVVVNNGMMFPARDRVLEDFLNHCLVSRNIAQEALNHLDRSLYDKRINHYKTHILQMGIQQLIEKIIH